QPPDVPHKAQARAVVVRPILGAADVLAPRAARPGQRARGAAPVRAPRARPAPAAPGQARPPGRAAPEGPPVAGRDPRPPAVRLGDVGRAGPGHGPGASTPAPRGRRGA